MKGYWNIKINLVKFHIEGLFGTQPVCHAEPVADAAAQAPRIGVTTVASECVEKALSSPVAA